MGGGVLRTVDGILYLPRIPSVQTVHTGYTSCHESVLVAMSVDMREIIWVTSVPIRYLFVGYPTDSNL